MHEEAAKGRNVKVYSCPQEYPRLVHFGNIAASNRYASPSMHHLWDFLTDAIALSLGWYIDICKEKLIAIINS